MTPLCPAHRQRVGVVEAELHRSAESHPGQFAVDLLQRCRVLVLEDFSFDSAEVFGIDVDAAGLQRFEHDGGVAQPLPMLDLRMRCGGLANDFPEDVGLGEALRSDVQHLICAGSTRRGGEQENEECEEREECDKRECCNARVSDRHALPPRESGLDAVILPEPGGVRFVQRPVSAAGTVETPCSSAARRWMSRQR